MRHPPWPLGVCVKIQPSPHRGLNVSHIFRWTPRWSRYSRQHKPQRGGLPQPRPTAWVSSFYIFDTFGIVGPEGRQRIAHGVSRGSESCHMVSPAPVGATDSRYLFHQGPVTLTRSRPAGGHARLPGWHRSQVAGEGDRVERAARPCASLLSLPPWLWLKSVAPPGLGSLGVGPGPHG